MALPLIITPGDPAGIGPEIALKALISAHGWSRKAVIMGQISHLGTVAEQCGLSAQFKSWSIGESLDDDAISVFELSWPAKIEAGTPNPENAPIIIGAIEQATKMALQGHVAGIVTCPISKASLYQAGFTYPGHTEFLGALSGDKLPIMMLANQSLRAVPATIHIPLAKVSDNLSREGLVRLISAITKALRSDFGIKTPTIALCGLNPHAGEDGKMGHEEVEIITPAIEQAQKALGQQAHIIGPFAADSLFYPEKLDSYDCVIGMYHDQALIPVKTIDFHGSVNITLGLDFIRTSPDHGTAFAIAGQNIARADSLINALCFAEQMAENRRTQSVSTSQAED